MENLVFVQEYCQSFYIKIFVLFCWVGCKNHFAENMIFYGFIIVFSWESLGIQIFEFG